MGNLQKLHEAQREFWRGNVGKQWAENHVHLNQMLQPMGEAMLERVAPCPGERVLDIGCGVSTVSFRAAAQVGNDGCVLGIDISPHMIDVARATLAERGLANLSFALSDAATCPFEPEWDLVMSRYGVMFFGDPVAAFRNIRQALTPTGRLGFVCWRAIADNQWVSVPLAAAADVTELPAPPPSDAPGPYSLANADRIHTILSGAGFRHVEITAIDRDVSINFGSAETLHRAAAFFVEFGPLRRILSNASEEARTRVKHRLPETLSAFETNGTIVMGSASWIVTAVG